ncbi:MAG: sigma-70 family RNA polymerase sigma factor [Verrucomicrobia bacterium]|nr:sigma-70 family RNA polymerase sigma factor [Verrucomicrobiota bacterium]
MEYRGVGRSEFGSKAEQALASLCEVYWYPLYAFVRRQGHSPQDAQDLTQAFFARFLEKDYLKDVDRQKGKFRSFLLASLKHFLADQRDRDQAQKRGGGKALVSLDAQTAETRYLLEPHDDLTPDKIFERRWALTLLEQAMARLREEFTLAGKSEFFDQLKVFMAAEKGPVTYAGAAAKLSTTEAAVKMSVQRMRRRYRELLRAEIAHTVARTEEIDEELRHLAEALRG